MNRIVVGSGNEIKSIASAARNIFKKEIDLTIWRTNETTVTFDSVCTAQKKNCVSITETSVLIPCKKMLMRFRNRAKYVNSLCGQIEGCVLHTVTTVLYRVRTQIRFLKWPQHLELVFWRQAYWPSIQSEILFILDENFRGFFQSLLTYITILGLEWHKRLLVFFQAPQTNISWF